MCDRECRCHGTAVDVMIFEKMKLLKTSIFALLLLLLVADATAWAGSAPQSSKMENRVKVSLETSLGTVVVALYNETPQHRDNFIKLVKENFYEGVLFHRVIKNFMVQCGDPESKTAGPDAQLGAGDVGYTIPAEFVYPKFYHKRGALAAARTGDQFNPERRSSGCQFYIVTGRSYTATDLATLENRLGEQMKQNLFNALVRENMDSIKQLQQAGNMEALGELETELIAQTETQYATNPFQLTEAQRRDYTTMGGTPHLDGQYTVFGEVLEGMDVIEQIQNSPTSASDRPVTDIKIVKAQIIE